MISKGLGRKWQCTWQNEFGYQGWCQIRSLSVHSIGQMIGKFPVDWSQNCHQKCWSTGRRAIIAPIGKHDLWTDRCESWTSERVVCCRGPRGALRTRTGVMSRARGRRSRLPAPRGSDFNALSLSLPLPLSDGNVASVTCVLRSDPRLTLDLEEGSDMSDQNLTASDLNPNEVVGLSRRHCLKGLVRKPYPPTERDWGLDSQSHRIWTIRPQTNRCIFPSCNRDFLRLVYEIALSRYLSWLKD